MVNATTTQNLGSITWKALTGQSVVQVEVAKKDPLDKSHMPTDEADLTEADKLAKEEKASKKQLKSFFAAAAVFENTVRMLGGLGNFWGMINGLMGNTPAGWTAVWAGAGSALTVTDASFQTKTAAVNRNLPAAIDGTFSMVQGMGVMLTAMGLGRIPSLVAAGALVAKIGYGMYRSVQQEKEKEEAKKQDEERKKQAQAAKQAAQQQPAQAPAATAPAAPTAPAQPPAPAAPPAKQGAAA